MMQDIKVKISNLTKIFGPKADSVLKHVDNGMGKDDLLKEHKPELLDNILNTPSSNDYIQGLQDGEREFRKQKSQNRAKEIDNIRKSKDKNFGLER